MDKIISLTKELGKAIQQHETYLNLNAAIKAHESDNVLAQQMEAFQEKRSELNGEVQKEDKDPEKIKTLDGEVRALYSEIVGNDKVTALSQAQSEMQSILKGIDQIVQGSANGENPDEIDFYAACSASDCAGCSGC